MSEIPEGARLLATREQMEMMPKALERVPQALAAADSAAASKTAAASSASAAASSATAAQNAAQSAADSAAIFVGKVPVVIQNGRLYFQVPAGTVVQNSSSTQSFALDGEEEDLMLEAAPRNESGLSDFSMSGEDS